MLTSSTLLAGKADHTDFPVALKGQGLGFSGMPVGLCLKSEPQPLRELLQLYAYGHRRFSFHLLSKRTQKATATHEIQSLSHQRDQRRKNPKTMNLDVRRRRDLVARGRRLKQTSKWVNRY